jgi:hypothetical protein
MKSARNMNPADAIRSLAAEHDDRRHRNRADNERNPRVRKAAKKARKK